MTRPSPQGGPQNYPPAKPAPWMTVRVRIQDPLPQGDGDQGDAGESATIWLRAALDESGYGHGV
jgi:hypothetical protein